MVEKLKRIFIFVLAGLILGNSVGCTRESSSKEPQSLGSSQPEQSKSETTEHLVDENMDINFDTDQVAQGAFSVWKSMGYKPLSFFQEKDMGVEDLVELYTEFCLNSNNNEQLLSFNQDEHLNTDFQKYINRHFFKMSGFIEFSKKYFDISLDKNTLEKYEKEIDAYPLSSSYLYFDENAVTQISLESYEANQNVLSLFINYTNKGLYELEITVDSDGNFTFTSLNNAD